MSTFEANPQALAPEHIAISKSSGVKIDWRDGHHSQYELKYLRERCPCATCSGAHGTPPPDANPLQLYRPALKIEAVEPVGKDAVGVQKSLIEGGRPPRRGGRGATTGRFGVKLQRKGPAK